MVKNPKLARAISDASWGEFVRQLEYKTKWYGRSRSVSVRRSRAAGIGDTLVKIDRWFPSSKRCGNCGHVVERLPLNVREWDCPNCGTHHDRDINAAQNILAVGHTVKVCGANIRPDGHKSKGQLRKTSNGESSPVRAACPQDLGGSPAVGNWRTRREGNRNPSREDWASPSLIGR